MGSATHCHLRSFASVGARLWIGTGSTRMSLYGRADRRLQLRAISAQGWRLDPRRKANSRGHFVKRSRSGGAPPALGAGTAAPLPDRRPPQLREASRASGAAPPAGAPRGGREGVASARKKPIPPPAARSKGAAGGERRGAPAGQAEPRGREGGGNPAGRPRRGGRSPLRAGGGAATIGRGAAESSARRSGAGRRRRRRRRREGAGLRCAASLERSLAAAGAAAARG